MKVSEAITLLKALDPDQEVTLTITRVKKAPEYTPPSYHDGYYNPIWVNYDWPSYPDITCRRALQ